MITSWGSGASPWGRVLQDGNRWPTIG
jgi:hypothetical protein